MGICDLCSNAAFGSQLKKMSFAVGFVLLLILDFAMPDATVPVHVQKAIEGTNVTLRCHASNTKDPTSWRLESGSDPITYSINCRFKTDLPDIQIDMLNCDHQEKQPGGRWYNLTIINVKWAHDGNYSCANGRRESVLLKVLVPQKPKLGLEVIKDRDFSNRTSPPDEIDLRPSSKEDLSDSVVMNCTSSCSNPRPTILWYSVVQSKGQTRKVYFSGDDYRTKEETKACSNGLARTVSLLTLKPASKKPGEVRQNVTCEARQDLSAYGGTDDRQTKHLRVLFGEHVNYVPYYIIAAVAALLVLLMLVTVFVLVGCKLRRRGAPCKPAHDTHAKSNGRQPSSETTPPSTQSVGAPLVA